jgi:hypothetical protein
MVGGTFYRMATPLVLRCYVCSFSNPICLVGKLDHYELTRIYRKIWYNFDLHKFMLLMLLR